MYSSETPESKGSSFRGFTLPKISFDLAAVEKKAKDRRNSNMITLHQLDSDIDQEDKKSHSNKSDNERNRFANFDFLGPNDHLMPKEPKENLSVVEEECLTSKHSNNNSPAYLGFNLARQTPSKNKRRKTGFSQKQQSANIGNQSNRSQNLLKISVSSKSEIFKSQESSNQTNKLKEKSSLQLESRNEIESIDSQSLSSSSSNGE